MIFNNLIKDVNQGLKRKIYSRRDKITVTVKEFEALAKKYFKGIKDNHNFKFNYQLSDKDILVFVLRWYYHLWIKIDDNSIEILHSFPKKFKIVKEVNKSNHFHTPKTFKTGTIMYFNSSASGGGLLGALAGSSGSSSSPFGAPASGGGLLRC